MDETLWKQSLGRSVSLGDCYDATTEQFTGRNIFNKKLTKEVIREHNIRNQSWNYDFSNSTASKLSMFSLDGELKLSLLCDVLPNISGSAKFVKNAITNKEEIRCTFALFTNTIEQRIEIDDVDLLNFYNDLTKIDNFKGTHVVTRLKWGANAVAELFIENDEKLGKMEITGAIKANLGKIADIALSDASITGNVKYENFNLSKINKIRWSVNADVDLNTKTPKNAEEALNIIYHLPEKIKEEGNGRPLEFCLLPLKELKETLGCTNTTNTIFYKIQNAEILKVEHQFKEIETSRLDLLTLRDFMMRNIDYVIPNDLKTLKEFMNIFDISFTQFQQSISTKLNEVRSGKADQNQLLAIVETFKKESNAASPKVEEFTASFKTAERRINMLKDISQKGIIFIKNHAAFESTMLISNKDIYILSYSFNKINENRQWLENYQYFSKLHEQHKDEHMFCMIDFDITPEIQSSQDLAAEPQIHKVFNGKFVVKNILKEIKLFESICSVRCTQVHEIANIDYEKRIPVQFPCPNASSGKQCSKKGCDWYCVKCFSTIEYGFNDKFYCRCGCHKIENFEFKCDDHMHGNIYVKYSYEQLKSYIANIKKREEINILLLGQIGAGKTSLIKTAESICFEMMRHPSLKDKTQLVEFSQSMSDDEDLISSDNEDEEAKTKECQGYHIPYGKYVLNFIDTPGLGDCRGIKQDKKHLEKIFSFAEKCGSLNAVCIFIKPDESIVSQYCLIEYLSNFPQK
uniref:G domain-containing protein n=1 Tax=Panagrolaimus davidi TaxID=227884 RepID=A0A914PLU1_9BILA